MLDGQREMNTRLALIEGKLAETTIRDLRLICSFGGQVVVASIRRELLRETLASRIKTNKA